jgi:uncharacterized protein (TIGR02599 family)
VKKLGFSILELLLSISLLAVLMLIIGQILSNSTRAWERGRSKITRFQQARQAFETVQQRLASATLAPYLDYEYNSSAPSIPVSYGRRSDLVFRSGEARSLIGQSGSGQLSGHALIFTTAAGLDQGPSRERFRSLLNLCGFYVSHGPPANVPGRGGEFGLTTTPQFGLFEFCQPTTYSPPTNAGGLIAAAPIPAVAPRLLAENIFLLLILPLAPIEFGAFTYSPKTPSLRYDSSEHHHRLPLSVRVIMIAMDEASAVRVRDMGISSKLVPPYLFKSVTTSIEIDNDLHALEDHLNSDLASSISYQIFDTTLQLPTT